MELSPLEQDIQRNCERLYEVFRDRKSILGVAESCTGGMLCSYLTNISGISEVFSGGIVSYSYSSKINLLSVPEKVLTTQGAVSEEVVKKMAEGARSCLSTDWSVAMTGVAGPLGGTPEKPVGTVWFAVCGPNIVMAETKFFQGTRQEIRQQSVLFALEFLLENFLDRVNKP